MDEKKGPNKSAAREATAEPQEKRQQNKSRATKENRKDGFRCVELSRDSRKREVKPKVVKGKPKRG